jgi:FMN reductase (NADPH)/FMN reductase [NAD(P)H]
VNPTLEVIHKRRSLRSYSDHPLTDEEKEIILQATFRAPTAGNMMLYSIIDVEDQAIKEKLVKTCDNQPFIARAPWVLLFLADYQRWYDYYKFSGVDQRCKMIGVEFRKPEVGDMLLACCDALIAAQTAVLAAESLGIGSCYIGDILENWEIHQEMFKLPDYVVPITMVCFGKPPFERSNNRKTSRFAQEFIVFKNQYRRLQQDDFERMFQPVIDRFSGTFLPEAENWGQQNYFRKFIADFSVEMSRSVREILKNWGE